MPTPPPRHLATPRRPWRLLLFVFGSPPRSWPPWWPRPPCCPSPNRHAGYPASRCRRRQHSQPRRPRRPTSPPLPGSRPPRLPLPPLRILGGGPSADRPRPPDRLRPKRRPRSAVATPPTAPSTVGATTQPIVTAPPTTAGPTTTALTSTVASTTTLVSTTSIAPTTGPTTSAAPSSTGPATTTTGPTTTGAATTTTGPVILSGSRPAGVSAATVGALLPILGLLYLLRGLVPQAGGTHARRRRASHLRRRG